MSNRAKRRAHNQNRGLQPQLRPQTIPGQRPWQWFSLLSPTGKLAASLGLFLTIVGAYYAFSPKLSITPLTSLDPNRAFMTPFVVRNDSLLSINSIELECKSSRIVLENNAELIGGFKANIPPIPKLISGEESTFLLPYPPNLSPPVKFADVLVEITYSPSLLPFKKMSLKRFITVRASDGTFHWISKALSE